MSKLKYPLLFEPMTLSKQVFRNRILASAQDYPGLTAEGFVTEEGAYFYERKAQGGFASVTVGDMIVDQDHGRTHPFQMRGLDLRGKVNLGRMATAIKRHGALASIELCDGGANASTELYPEGNTGIAYGPSAYTRVDGVEVREMTTEQIEAMIQRYIDAASFAVQTGFNEIMIHAGHGWQIHQFLSPTFNHRTDEWGGSVENRCKVLVNIIEGIRKEVGRRTPIEIKISAKEWLPNGYELDEGIAICKQIDGLADIINVTSGHHEDPIASMHSSPTMFDPDGEMLDMTYEIKKNIEQSKISAIGGFTDPEMMEEVLEEGKCDFFQLARQSLADPDFPIKARAGKIEEIRPCLRCFNCFNNSTINGVFYCTVNPEIGREVPGMFSNNKASVQKKVVVIGGGPGGMQAALTAAQQGHQVIIAEKNDRFGGCLLCEEKVPFKQNLEKYLYRQGEKCKKNPNIEVHLGFEATPAWVESQGADVVITALGSKPMVIPIPGIENAVCADDVYVNPELAGDTVAIMGGGLVGLELGLYLSSLGKKVTVVEMAPGTCATPASDAEKEGTSKRMTGLMGLPAGYPLVQGGAIAYARLRYPDYEIKCSTAAKAVTDEGLLVDEKGVGEHVIPADTVIYAVGQVPLTEEAHKFSGCAPEFYEIGDCVNASNVYTATSTAYQIALDLGRDVYAF